MEMSNSERNDYDFLPSYAGIAVALSGLLISSAGAVTMIFFYLNVGFLIVLSGWSLLIFGNVMDNTGLLISSEDSGSELNAN